MARLVAVALLVGCALAGCSSAPGAPPRVAVAPATLQLRPVLCFAPAYDASAGRGVRRPSALPRCASPYRLTASALDVGADPSSVGGFTVSGVDLDPAYLPYRSTPRSRQAPAAPVLVPGPTGDGGRVVLGPSLLGRTAVATATAVQDPSGRWAVALSLTPVGSRLWDRVSRELFHQYVAIVVNGEVLSAPLLEPTQDVWSSFQGGLEISGDLSRSGAQHVAAEL